VGNSESWWLGFMLSTVGLFRSVALVVCLMRKNITQEFAGAIFGVSQATVSRRWDLLRPLTGQVFTEFVPDPRDVVGVGTVLVDGTICPTSGSAKVSQKPAMR
jgi:hypothetical protein